MHELQNRCSKEEDQCYKSNQNVKRFNETHIKTPFNGAAVLSIKCKAIVRSQTHVQIY